MDPICPSFVTIWLMIMSLLYFIKLLIWNRRKFQKCPPRLRGVPVLGYLPFLRKDTHRHLQELTKMHGNISQINIGTKPVLVLNDWASIKEAFINKWDAFSDRPFMISNRIRLGHKVEIVGQDVNPKWRHQRRFAVKTLRKMGMGNTVGEKAILDEVEKLVAQFTKYSGKIILSEGLFFVTSVSVILKISCGESLQNDSQEAEKLRVTFKKVVDFISQSNIYNLYPILRFFTNSCQNYKASTEIIKEYLSKIIHDHKLVYSSENDPKDYIESYLQQMYNNSTFVVRSDEICSFSDERLLGDLVNLFNAGAETTATTMSWALLYMLIWPDIQTKVHKEIDETIGKFNMPQYKDRPMLPYTNAVILEVQRYATVAPLSAPHKSRFETELLGFHIPANMTVWPNIWAVHHDPELWGDPEVFRPERFIDEEGKVFEPEYFIPFSVGARRCIGELLAKMELFLFFASLMQKFTFSIPDGHPLPTLEPMTGGSLRPHPHSMIVENR